MDPGELLVQLMAQPEATVELDQACLLIAAAVRPAADGPAPDVPAALDTLDALAAACAEPTVEAVLDLLYRREGFAGNRDHYHDPANSYLDDVLVRRSGMPITLAVVVIEVARRVGVAVVGVGLPGHFLVAGPGPTYIDPFAGLLIDQAEIVGLFHRVHGPDAPFHAGYLQPVGAVAIVGRILANLRRDLSAAGSLRAALEAARLRAQMPGMAPSEWSEVARLQARLGRYRDAAATLESVAERLPDAAAATARREARLLRARLN